MSFKEAKMIEEEHQADIPTRCRLLEDGGTYTRFDRAAIANQMTAASHSLGLSSEALHLSVAMLDRCLTKLSLEPQDCDMLWSLACACLWVAAKYEGHVVPTAQGVMEAMQQDTSRAPQLHELEALVLQAMDYRVCAGPTAAAFLQLILLSWPTGIRRLTYHCAWYLVEMSLLEGLLLSVPASEVAAAAFVCAFNLTSSHINAAELASVTGYTIMDGLWPTLVVMFAMHNVMWHNCSRSPEQRYAVLKLFRHRGFACVAKHVPGIKDLVIQLLRLAPSQYNKFYGNKVLWLHLDKQLQLDDKAAALGPEQGVVAADGCATRATDTEGAVQLQPPWIYQRRLLGVFTTPDAAESGKGPRPARVHDLLALSCQQRQGCIAPAWTSLLFEVVAAPQKSPPILFQPCSASFQVAGAMLTNFGPGHMELKLAGSRVSQQRRVPARAPKRSRLAETESDAESKHPEVQQLHKQLAALQQAHQTIAYLLCITAGQRDAAIHRIQHMQQQQQQQQQAGEPAAGQVRGLTACTYR
ncbi:hypothetical protein OEZ85_010985 [Tetradesmus obliquus]|uniref:Cyclin N-terminal domain-containing protein n=1 Tax=Tetradesmus obliquus TaxID=3088 RepID=A0ABY8TR25_TETOB|nr:hypothetical protein OEZ85_010985 [Tetradesmus obliquus]